jgi:hypothetical protein
MMEGDNEGRGSRLTALAPSDALTEFNGRQLATCGSPRNLIEKAAPLGVAFSAGTLW